MLRLRKPGVVVRGHRPVGIIGYRSAAIAPLGTAPPIRNGTSGTPVVASVDVALRYCRWMQTQLGSAPGPFESGDRTITERYVA